MGLESIYPTLFEKTPIYDPVKLQTCLFALQYSCAQTWTDCGLRPTAVVGHSFGELTALCIAGVLSMEDTLRIVAARAKLVKEEWGSEPGAMMAVEGEMAAVKAFLNEASSSCPEEPPVTIACFNGPKSFTLAGTTKAMESAKALLDRTAGLRGKLLAVLNAFHSILVEPLETKLATIAEGVSFSKGTINWARATEQPSDAAITSDFFATHMRQPVYANHAFQRLHAEYPEANWLEAGSNSTITNMASKALGSPKTSHFQSVNILNPTASENLLDTVISLWKEGLNVQHWRHEASLAPNYRLVLLPPYQFEKSRHWMDLKKPQKMAEQAVVQAPAQADELPTSLYTFVGYNDDKKTHARFRINTMIKKYEELVSGHVVAQTAPICPATVVVDITIEALLSIRPDLEATFQPEVHGTTNMAPICVDPSRTLWLDARSVGGDFCTWSWEINSKDHKGSGNILHVKGQVVFRSSSDPKLIAECARFGRFIDHQRCVNILECADPDDTIVGRNMYKVFSEIVDYSQQYRGLQKLVGKGNASAGRVERRHSEQTWLDAHLSDCYSQVGGFWVNCMTDRAPADMYLATGFESWMRAPQTKSPVYDEKRTSTWDVMALHNKALDTGNYTSDIFIYNAGTGALSEVILGVSYTRVPKAVMTKTLLRLTAKSLDAEHKVAPSKAVASTAFPTVESDVTARVDKVSASPAAVDVAPHVTDHPEEGDEPILSPENSGRRNTLALVADVLADLTGLEVSDMQPDTKLADIGIDSLMGMELVGEIESTSKCTLPMEQMAEATIIRDVVDAVASALGIDPSDSDLSGGDMTDTSRDSASISSNDAESVTSVSDVEEPPNFESKDEDLKLPFTVIKDAFDSAKLATDQFIRDYGCDGYMNNISPKQTHLCVALILEAFEQLGCNIRDAQPGDTLPQIVYAPKHKRLVQYLYEVLETDARLIDIDGSTVTRTAVAASTKTSSELVETLVKAYPDHNYANQLAYYCGSRLTEVLADKLDGVKLIFGSDEGRDLVSGLYGESLLNKLSYKQMEKVVKGLVAGLPTGHGPLKILEMGAGTGGTTQYLVPLLEGLGVPFEYTFTDLAPSFVAAARKKYKGKPYMNFRAHDIEKMPADDLIGTQHLIVASNAVHATHSLPESLKHIRQALRPDGFLMMLEMTETLRWVDIIFGLLEGWWLFEDGRPHALSHQTHWEKELHNSGYGHVDWTDGNLPETHIQRLIIACASGEQKDRVSSAKALEPVQEQLHNSTRKAAVKDFTSKYSAGWVAPRGPAEVIPTANLCVVVTGASGSVGTHLAAHLARLDSVVTVVCLNRVKRGAEPEGRQQQAMRDRGIFLDATLMSKLRVFKADTTKPCLGLAKDDYAWLVGNTTQIIHNAWPMSGNRPLSRFEPQLQVMRNLIDLASAARTETSKCITLQFISSIAVVGHQPLVSGNPLVREERVDIDSVLSNGYGEAKYVCELMLDETLHHSPDSFRTMSVRLGQVAGSTTSGYWNTQEHLSFLVKSAQTLRALPDFTGQLSWTPVDIVAATLSDLAISDRRPAPIYHIDNPVRQPWEDTIKVWASELGTSDTVDEDLSVVPFAEWIRRVRQFPGLVERDNPAAKLVDFLDDNFLRMSCGGLLLDTAKAQEHSTTLANTGPVSAEVTSGYIRYWKEFGYLW